MCPTILDDSKTYLSRKWIFDDKNVFIVRDVEGKLNEWIKLFGNTLKTHQTLFIKYKILLRAINIVVDSITLDQLNNLEKDIDFEVKVSKTRKGRKNTNNK